MKIEITDHSKWYQSITLKLILLAFMGLFLLIPLEMIKQIIKERQTAGEKVIKEISDQWATEQTLSGPVLNIPFRSADAGNDEKVITGIWHILPENLDIETDIKPEIRYRGIYKAVVYDSEVNLKGEMAVPVDGSLKGSEILWGEAYYTMGISDNRGLKGKLVLETGSDQLEAEPGVKDTDFFLSGVSFPAPYVAPGKTIPFTMHFSLSGSEGLFLTPVGKTTNVTMTSTWPSPSFKGNFLPVKRETGEKGFKAYWEVTHLNRNYPQSWTGNAFQPKDSSFGTELFQPVDHYQKSWRSARYGILFIALTYLVLIFLEITRKETINIFHYFLVSLGLVLFFSLLNALSEQLGFNISYLISSVSTIVMISLFTSSLLMEKRRVWIVSGMLVVLYAFIFVLLSLNDFAYLAGNIGLFILLSVVMILAGKMKALKADNQI
jgi:inner membrane protein